MRKGSLELLAGGGVEATCDMCALGLFLDGTAGDEATKAAMLAELTKLPGRAKLCGDHREDLEGMGVKFSAHLQTAKPTRQQRRASAAAMKRAHRRSLPRMSAPPREPPKPGGGGGIAF